MKPTVRSQYRLPREIDDWLCERAKKCIRSKNGQLVAELRSLMLADVKERPGVQPHSHNEKTVET
ncbi:MAG: hypothetical protein EPN57_26700 [Paraburkholderia sp.]|nr:MAG: hypothetical protein EPN57_26700 [Paraburkholderia sp.]